MLRNYLSRCAGVVLIWVSAVIITLGTLDQTTSPRFAEYMNQGVAEYEASHPGAEIEVGPTVIIAPLILFPLMGCFCYLVGLMFTAGAATVHLLPLWRRDAGLFAAGVFGYCCLIGLVLSIWAFLDKFGWGFTVLGVGYLTSGAGFVMGAVGSAGQWFVGRQKKVYSADSRSFDV